MDSVFSAVTALVVGITSTKAFDYYWKVYKSKSETGANGALMAKDETIQLTTHSAGFIACRLGRT